MDELTEFIFPEEHKVWWIPVHAENSYYESLYRQTPISMTDTINTPATFETSSGLYLTIHEANLTDYASMTLRKNSKKQYTSELVPWANGIKVYAKAPFSTPWRTIIVAENPGELVTSTIMLNLNEPSVLQDVSWIEPSKYIGIWWGMHMEKYTWGQGPRHGATTENTMRHIDFAAENGFGGVLVEGWNYGWDGRWFEDGTGFSFTQSYPDFDLEKVGLYAASKNVRLIGHHETGGATLNYERQLEDAFKLYQKNGVNAVKTGYVNQFLDGKEWHDGQYGVRHYRKVIETAAQHKIMINNHEPVKGTGLQRTFPNLMSQEGGRGQEYDAWSADGGNPPSHTTILPFTRMLSGPFDFTPGTFNFDNKVNPKSRVQTTLAKQLALYVIIFSPQQMASDLPENYLNNPAFQFIKDVPCIWSETKVLNAKIGEYVTMARKNWDGNEWFLGSISNEQPRNYEIPLSFLDDNISYQAEIYSDGENADWKTNPYPVDIKTEVVDRNSKLKIDLKSGGGAAVRVKPRKEK
jgi:alpha-glucosidase